MVLGVTVYVLRFVYVSAVPFKQPGMINKIVRFFGETKYQNLEERTHLAP